MLKIQYYLSSHKKAKKNTGLTTSVFVLFFSAQIIGFLAKYFAQMVACQQQMQGYEQQGKATPLAHLAFGLHPFYITEHKDSDLQRLEQFIQQYSPIAIGEIGLDTFTAPMKIAENYARQQEFFGQRLELAKQYQLPALLHIRRAHGDVIKMLKAQKFTQGGIAHSFSGGEQEAKAFVKLGCKLGVTGQMTKPNAKRLRHAIQAAVDTYGMEWLVIETDCPDMTPIMCQDSIGSQSALGQSPDDEWGDAPAHNRNVPANLPWVLLSLSELLDVPPAILAEQLWHNSCNALQTDWRYPA